MTCIHSTNDFLHELNNTYFNDEDESKICPINSLPFDENAITLPCNHKFNYTSLFDYIHTIKKGTNRYNSVHLRMNEIQCPMCRNISNKLLPFIPYENNVRISGITKPAKYCMAHKKCEVILRSGKNKGKPCNKAGYYTCKYGNICETHEKLFMKQSEKTEVNNTPSENEIFNSIWKKYTIVKLKNLLRQNKLTVSGNKKMLITRLLENNIDIL